MTSRDNDRSPTQRKFEVRPGKDFEESTEPLVYLQFITAETAKLKAETAKLEADTKNRMARTTDWVAWFILGGSAIALAGSAMHGYSEGNYDKLHWVWTVVAPFVGGVVGFYFGRKME